MTTKTESDNESDTFSVEADYATRAHALAVAVNGLYHSHRQGVVLCDYLLAIYDNNGGFPNREAFWRSLRDACSTARFEVVGEGHHDGEDAPYTRTLLVRCKFPERREGLVTLGDQVRAAQIIRASVVQLKVMHHIDDGHDVVLIVPQDRRQDQIEAAIKSGLVAVEAVPTKADS